ncbi:MAG: hypothetical protein P8L32_00780, partial [Paracoccaceae bacterium]|nr:hypothetical protein [Paracoccaceae bacterium]
SGQGDWSGQHDGSAGNGPCSVTQLRRALHRVSSPTSLVDAHSRPVFGRSFSPEGQYHSVLDAYVSRISDSESQVQVIHFSAQSSAVPP